MGTKRTAFEMKLFPGKEEEYKKRHDEIWPELVELLCSYGITDYDIYLNPESLSLFGFFTLDEECFDGEKLATEPVLRKWWHYMKDLMETNSDESPVSVPLELVFRM
jgi:L-rhamnose mutarotase